MSPDASKIITPHLVYYHFYYKKNKRLLFLGQTKKFFFGKIS